MVPLSRPLALLGAILGCDGSAADVIPASAMMGIGSAAADAVPSAWMSPPPTLGKHHRGCDKLDTKLTHFRPWEDLDPFGGLALPRAPAARPIPLVVHLHGHLGAVLELDKAKVDFALAGVSFSPGSYDGHLATTSVFGAFVDDARKKAKPHVEDELFAVSAWSNGYEGVRTLLEDDAIDARALVLIDALHGALDEPSRRIQLSSFVRWATRARRGEVFMFISHSAIETYTYASTTQATDTLLQESGGDLPPFEAPQLAGDELYRAGHEGGLYVLGYKGNDRDAHCRQITLLPYALQLATAWAQERQSR
jgi:hypothetical protein